MLPLRDDDAATVSRPVWRGRQAVAGVWFAAATVPEEERLRRILRHWRRGATVLRFGDGDLLRLPSPVDMAVADVDGWPLCMEGQVWSSAPLSAAERAALPAGDLVLVLGGRPEVRSFAQAQPIDPATWLDVARVALHDTRDLRLPAAAPELLVPEGTADIREVLGDAVPPASREQRDFLLAASRRAATRARPGRRPVPWRMAGGILAALLLAWVGLAVIAESGAGSLSGVSALLGFLVFLLIGRWRASGSSWSSAPQPQPRPGRQGAPRRADASLAGIAARRLRRVAPKAWRDRLARLAITTHLSDLLGRRQAAYVRRMLEMFETGNLDEALRHAIPLGGNEPSQGQAFGTPSRRDDLSFTDLPSVSARLDLGPDLDSHLRTLYRQVFERLDREGRIDEAVFVLAQLLRNQQEALDYLERHGRHDQAARLALGWDCPAETIVRLLCLSGDWRRALAVARRDRAFANAVFQMSAKWPEAAARLRGEWADHLAAQGLWLEAVTALWSLPDRRAEAAAWLNRAEAEAGVLGARALVMRVALLPDAVEQSAARLQAMALDPGLSTERAALVEALLATKHPSRALRDLARQVAPAVLADQAAGEGRFLHPVLRSLLKLADDPWLDADLPSGVPLPEAVRQPLDRATTMVEWDAPEAGALEIVDAIPVGDGRCLVALGEAGAALVDPSGRVAVRFAAPAFRIVRSTSGAVALVLAPRNDIWRVSRLDLVRRTVTDLGSTRLAAFADAFDGVAWWVSDGRSLRVLDTRESLGEALWQVGDLGGEVRQVSASETLEQALVEGPHGLALWQYRLPQRRLMGRDLVPAAISLGVLHPLAGWLRFTVHGEQLQAEGSFGRWSQDVGPVTSLTSGSSWLLVCSSAGEGATWQVRQLTTGRLHGSLAWPGGSRSVARVAGAHVLVFDGVGRLWTIDTTSGLTTRASVR